MDMGSELENEIQNAYELLKEGNPLKAKEVFSRALISDLDNPEILFGLKCSSFWIEHLQQISQDFDFSTQGEQIISDWKGFLELITKEESDKYEQCIYSVKKGVFTHVLEIFQQLLRENSAQCKDFIFSRMGLCYKELGDYETALRFLSEANAISPKNASVLAEMADCYAMCGEERTAKVLFREAFFINPQDVDIPLLESELFCRLYASVLEKWNDKEIAAEWVPVEGVLLGVFNVKRELRALEAGKLKQTIYALENELKDKGSEPDILIPRLINSYFWLIDHYDTVHEDRSRINETLLKIKLLNNDVYERY